MVNISLLQTDDRPNLNYLLLSKKVNIKICNYFNYNYNFIEIDNSKLNLSVKQYNKLYVVNEFLNSSTDDILIFLDSDAWVNDGIWLNQIINDLINDDCKNGCFSRTPYRSSHTFINSGSFIIKNNDFIKKMYKDIISLFEKDMSENNKDSNLVRKKNGGWCDQFYISNFVFNNKEKFNVFIPEILNTPDGMILRHNWFKHQKMFDDLNYLINNDVKINELLFEKEKYLDTKCFPNK